MIGSKSDEIAIGRRYCSHLKLWLEKNPSYKERFERLKGQEGWANQLFYAKLAVYMDEKTEAQKITKYWYLYGKVPYTHYELMSGKLENLKKPIKVDEKLLELSSSFLKEYIEYMEKGHFYFLEEYYKKEAPEVIKNFYLTKNKIEWSIMDQNKFTINEFIKNITNFEISIYSSELNEKLEMDEDLLEFSIKTLELLNDVYLQKKMLEEDGKQPSLGLTSLINESWNVFKNNTLTYIASLISKTPEYSNGPNKVKVIKESYNRIEQLKKIMPNKINFLENKIERSNLALDSKYAIKLLN